MVRNAKTAVEQHLKQSQLLEKLKQCQSLLDDLGFDIASAHLSAAIEDVIASKIGDAMSPEPGKFSADARGQ